MSGVRDGSRLLGAGSLFLVLLALGACHRPALRLVSVEAAPERLLNGDFEEGRGAAFSFWEPWGEGCAPGAGRGGSRGVHCHNEAPVQRGVGQRLVLDQELARPLLVSGWSRAREVRGEWEGDYALYVDLIYQDGEEVWGQYAPFAPGTHDWQEARLVIRPSRPVRELSVYGLFRGHVGGASFDGFSVRELGGAGTALFDGLPVVPAEERRAGPGKRLETGDGLALEYDGWRGAVAGLWVEGRPLAGGGGVSGFMARDVARGSDFYAFEQGRCPFLNLRLEVEVEAREGCIYIGGTLANTGAGLGVDVERDADATRVEVGNTSRARQDRAITLVFALPLGKRAGWTWHEDGRRSRAIEGGQEYVHTARAGTGADGTLSLYPWALVEDGRTGVMLGMDIERPAQCRLGYSGGAGLFYIAFDVGLVPEAGPAAFAFVLARTDPAWGFRAAAEKYYALFPQAFAVRVREQGIWMPFTDVSTVRDWEDFGFRFHEGDNNVAFDDGAGILSFRYSEVSTWWMAMDPQVPRTAAGVERVFAESLERGDRRARAVAASGSHDEQGQLQYQIRDEPWCDGAVFSSNPNPWIPGASEAAMRWNEELRQKLYGPGAAGELDGEYLDSVEGYVTAVENYRREHFQCARAPLTFGRTSRRPLIHKALAMHEFCGWLAGQLRAMDRLVFGNAVPERYAFLAPHFDIMGTETDWLSEGEWSPPTDGWFLFKRTLAGAKPYLLLMNADFDALDPERVEKYFQRSLFYGMYPSMFSHNAAEDPYWETPRWYERDRPLFKEYIPLIKRVAEAGWRPVTRVRSTEPEVWVERFGPDAEGAVYLTLFNAGERERRALLQVERALWAGGEAVEMRGGSRRVARLGAGGAEVEVDIGPGDVRVLRLQPSF